MCSAISVGLVHYVICEVRALAAVMDVKVVVVSTGQDGEGEDVRIVYESGYGDLRKHNTEGRGRGSQDCESKCWQTPS